MSLFMGFILYMFKLHEYMKYIQEKKRKSGTLKTFHALKSVKTLF